MALPWPNVYLFCERIYTNLLKPVQGVSLHQVRAYYENGLNQLLAEEYMAYEFKDGVFVGPGGPHTQKIVPRAMHVLTM